MTTPGCDAHGTITLAELDKKLREVCEIRYLYADGSGYLTFALRTAPARRLYLATRRNRARPKAFKDQNRLMKMLSKRFAPLQFEAVLD